MRAEFKVYDKCAEVCATEVQREPASKPTYAQLAAQVVILTAERDAVIRERDAWADCYRALEKLLYVPEC